MSGAQSGGADDGSVSAHEQYTQPGETPRAAADERAAVKRHGAALDSVANPDDPPVWRPPRGHAAPRPGPDFTGVPGRVAIVQGQVYLVGVILVAQLVLVTIALFELLSGRTQTLWWIAGSSLVGFLIALLIALWPRRRILRY